MSQNSAVVEKFEYKGKTCLIIQIGNITDVYHNGYIKVGDSKEEVEIKRRESGITEGYDVTYEQYLSDIEADELTFSGIIDREEAPKGYYLGFDSAHYWNSENPESKTHHAVKRRTKQMVEEFFVHNVFKRVRKDNGKQTCQEYER